MTKEERTEHRQTLAELERIKDLYANALRAAENVVTERRQETQTEQAQKNTDSESGVSYSIREEYAKEVEVWNKNGKSDGETFILGTTGDVLQVLGAIESDIYMLGDKIKEILNDHPEITIDVIKKIPQILDDPVMVIKSKQIRSRLVVFGSVKAQNGKPILVVLDLRPHEKGFMLNDMQKVNSAYTKTETFNRTAEENGKDFVEKSEILYLDKKRTTYLLSAIGFYMPITCNQSGFFESITYEGDNINIKGEDFSKVFKETTKSVKPDFSLKDQDYLKAVDNGDMVTAQRMVDEAAEKAGYTFDAYHGTGADFNIFSEENISSRNVWGKGFYFGTSKGIADDYASYSTGNRRKCR